MLRILFGIPYILFILPPIGYVALAVTMVGLGISINNIQTTSEQEKANALAIPMADAVPLNAFDNDDRGLMDEIHIAAQINNDYNYTLYEGTERDSTPHAM